jgi:Sucrose hydrolase-like, C-terminal domain
MSSAGATSPCSAWIRSRSSRSVHLSGVSMVTLHNLSARKQTVSVDPKAPGGNLLVNVFDDAHSRSEGGAHAIPLEPYGHRWFRVGAVDNALNRTAF